MGVSEMSFRNVPCSFNTVCLSLVSVVILLASVTSASAEDFRVIVDKEPSQVSGVLSNVTASDDAIVFWAMSDRCYCCSILAQDTSLLPRLSTVTGPSAETLRTKDRGATEPTLETDEKVGNPSQRVCFTAEESGLHRSVITFQSGATSAPLVEVRCDETTLYGGFNTSIADYNFLEVSNLQTQQSGVVGGSDGTNISITLQDIVNNSTPVDNVPSVVLSDRRFDFDIHSLVGPGVYGTVRLCHDSAPGNIKARVSQYQVKSTGVELVGSSELKRRSE